MELLLCFYCFPFQKRQDLTPNRITSRWYEDMTLTSMRLYYIISSDMPGDARWQSRSDLLGKEVEQRTPHLAYSILQSAAAVAALEFWKWSCELEEKLGKGLLYKDCNDQCWYKYCRSAAFLPVLICGHHACFHGSERLVLSWTTSRWGSTHLVRSI